MRDLYRLVSDKILAQLEKGTVPWIKPWSQTAGGNVPCNAVSKRPYSGVNVVLLWGAMFEKGFTVPRFVTFKQAKELGGHVKKGEKGTQIYFVKKLQYKTEQPEGDDGEDEVRSVMMLREYTVFNVSQCEGLPARVMSIDIIKTNHQERDPVADAFIQASGAQITEAPGDQAFYSPAYDTIQLPLFAQFKTRDLFYNTALHELGHWTGHPSRLNRDLKVRFGTQAYAAEELVAELTSAFLCAEHGMDNETQSASYIKAWIDLLKEDKKAFFTAASKAQQATDYLRGKTSEVTTQQAA
jgi:antirestriction protein ArdC